LVLVAVKGDAKDILLSYTVGQLDSVTKVFQVMLKEFKKREKCVAGLHQLKQDTNEKISIYASRIRRDVREMGVNAQKFDKISIDYLNWIFTLTSKVGYTKETHETSRKPLK
jgi:hypothetical protein